MNTPENKHSTKPSNLPSLGDITNWTRKHWARLTLSTLGLGGVTGGVWLWHEVNQQPVAPREQSINTPPSAALPGDKDEIITLGPDPTATATRIPEIATVTPTTAPATAGPSPSPSATEQPSPTAQATATQVEAKKDVPCLILPQEYCSQGQVIYTKNSIGGDEIFIGFTKLPANTHIFAGRKGQATKVQYKEGGEYKGFRVSVVDPNMQDPTALSYHIIGSVKPQDMYSVNVEQGAPIATITDSGITNLGDFQVLITVRRRSPNGAIPAEDVLKKDYPEAFEKPIITLPYSGPSNPVPNVSTIYSGGSSK